MKNTEKRDSKSQEKLLQSMRQTMLIEHIHSVAFALKIDETFLSELTNDAAKLRAIKKIQNKLLIDFKSRKFEDLIQMIATLTWKSKVLEHVSAAMAQKIEQDRESALKLLNREYVYEDIKISNRRKGAASSNKIFDSEIKLYAKKKREEILETKSKRCGAKTLQAALDESHKGHNLSIHVLNGWIKQWNRDSENK